MTKTTVLYAVFVMALGLVLVRRHTRTEEESGRQELIAATLVGRSAPLTSAVLEATLVMTALGVLAAVGDIAGGLPVPGSLLFGASWLGLGPGRDRHRRRRLPADAEHPHQRVHRLGRDRRRSTCCGRRVTRACPG